MKHVQTDKYTIAWFKIAECVSRGEKERALGVYRLLSHSFNDDALSKQLEADIYLSCNEIDQAIVLYRQSLNLYEKEQRLFEATAIAEHLVLLQPNDLSVRGNLLECYIKIGSYPKLRFYFQQLIDQKLSQQVVINAVEKILNFLLPKGQEKNLQDFFLLIDALDSEIYEYAYEYIKK